METELDSKVCEQLEYYFQNAIEWCGLELVKNSLLVEHVYEDYFESIGEVRQRSCEAELNHAKDEYQNVLFLRDSCINMQDMISNYELEDKALMKYNMKLAQLYNYLLQPFLDMRELAYSKLKIARNGLTNLNLGERPKQEFAAMFSEWQQNYVQSLDSIQGLYMKYYGETNKIYEGTYYSGDQKYCTFSSARAQTGK